MGSGGCVRQAANDSLVVSSIYFRLFLQLTFKSHFVVERGRSGDCVFHPKAFDNGLNLFGLSKGDGTRIVTVYFQA